MVHSGQDHNRKAENGLARWLIWESTSFMTGAALPGATWWEKRTGFYKVSCDTLYAHTK